MLDVDRGHGYSCDRVTRSVILMDQRQNPGMFLNSVLKSGRLYQPICMRTRGKMKYRPFLLLCTAATVIDVYVTWWAHAALANIPSKYSRCIFVAASPACSVHTVPWQQHKNTALCCYGARSDSNATHNTVHVRKSNTCAKCRRELQRGDNTQTLLQRQL